MITRIALKIKREMIMPGFFQGEGKKV